MKCGRPSPSSSALLLLLFLFMLLVLARGEETITTSEPLPISGSLRLEELLKMLREEVTEWSVDSQKLLELLLASQTEAQELSASLTLSKKQLDELTVALVNERIKADKIKCTRNLFIVTTTILFVYTTIDLILRH